MCIRTIKKELLAIHISSIPNSEADMSLYLMYFETKNPDCTEYARFSEVGKFQVPEVISAGERSVLFDGKEYRGGIISDTSKMCANNFFLKRGDDIKLVLIKFVSERMENNCVVANLFGFIEGASPPTIKNLKAIPYSKLEQAFTAENFKNGLGVTIDSRN